MNDGSAHWKDEALSAWLDGELPAREREELERHLASCDRCAGSVEALRAIVAAAGSLEERGPERDLWPEVEAGLTGSTAPRSGWTAALLGLAAGVLVTLGAMRLAGSDRESDEQVAAGGERFVLLLHESPELLAEATPYEVEAVVARYRDWARGLGRAGKLEAGEKLADAEGRTLRVRDGTTLVEERPERGGVGGFFVIRARDYEEAVDIARSCPHLGPQGWVELRRIEDT